MACSSARVISPVRRPRARSPQPAGHAPMPAACAPPPAAAHAPAAAVTAAASAQWSAWTESGDPAADLAPVRAPHPAPDPMPYVEVLVATPAGKPVLHYAHGLAPAPAPAHTPFRRPPAEQRSLAAASVAYAAVASDVRCVRTASGAVYFAATHQLHVVVAAADRAFPEPVLAALARLSVGFLAAVLSANLMTTLHDRPHVDVAPHLAPMLPRLYTLLDRALTHPLPYAALVPPSLPCPTSPGSRSALGDLLRDAIGRAPACVSHALLVTASAPFPRKLVTIAAPSAAPLTPLDLLILMSLLPDETDVRGGSTAVSADTAAKADESSDATATSRDNSASSLPARVFLQSTAHSTPYTFIAERVELRLKSDDYEMFEAAVGGSGWRPEWGASGGDVVWAVALAKTSSSQHAASHGRACVARIATALDESRAARDLIVAMERPWTVRDVPQLRKDAALLRATRGIVVLSADRCAATVGACDHALGMAFALALSASGWAAIRPEDRGVERRREDVWRVVDSARGVQIIGHRRQLLVAFDVETAEKVARTMFVDSLVPWEARYRASLLSEFDRVLLPARTMFGHLLAPFP